MGSCQRASLAEFAFKFALVRPSLLRLAPSRELPALEMPGIVLLRKRTYGSLDFDEGDDAPSVQSTSKVRDERVVTG